MPDSYLPPPQQAVRWVEQALGARVLRISRLVGGLTADMDRLTVQGRTDEPFDVVLRRWSAGAEWTIGLVDRESAGLSALADRDLPVPRLLAYDATGEQAGVAGLLMSALPGEPVLRPPDLPDYLEQLATMLVRIHDVPAELEPTDPHPYHENADWIGDAALSRAALEAAAAASLKEQQVLVHGDYQPFNALWRDQRLSGVVDWTFAGRGPRGLDVGHCRLNLAVLFSAEAAERFLDCYEAEAGLRVDPLVDIRSLLAFDLGWPQFIPLQVAGRAPVDGPGMAGRVAEVLRAAVARLP